LLVVPFIVTLLIFFLLSILQEKFISNSFSWGDILTDYAMDMGSISVAFFFFYYLLNKIYTAESKLLSSNNSLAETNYELESFIYRASHDFRTPLTTMKGILIASRLDKNPESHEKYFEMLQESTDRMDSYLLELMEITTNKHKKITSETINLSAFIKELIDEIGFIASLEKIDISFEHEADFTIVSDRTRLKILLRNILVNAVKYHDESKKRHLIKIGIAKENGGVKIDFWDNGIGIDENTLPKIFEMFYRGTHLSVGCGLGLYIAKTIAITLGYEITVESEIGQWTTATVYIKSSFNTVSKLN